MSDQTIPSAEIPQSGRATATSANALQRLYRLVRLASIHSMDNQAFVRALQEACEGLNLAATASGGEFTTAFAKEAIFINGSLLRAHRQTFELCRELAEHIDRVGCNELTVVSGVTEGCLRKLLARLAAGNSGESQDLGNIRLRRVDIKLPGADGAEDAAAGDAEAARFYSSAVVLVQRLVDDVRREDFGAYRFIKRLAHRFILHAESHRAVLRKIVLFRVGRREDASRAVNTAILVNMAASTFATDRRLLIRLVTAALLYDLGRPRAAGLGPSEGGRMSRTLFELSDDQRDRLPDTTALISLSVGHVSEETLLRATLLFEAHWLSRSASLGAPHGGKVPPSLEATLLSVARRLIDMVADKALTSPVSIGEAAFHLRQRLGHPLERQCLELLLRGAEVVPPGALVELESGWRAEVIRVSPDAALADHPTVRLHSGPQGEAAAAGELDLAAPGRHGGIRRILRLPTWLDAGGDGRLVHQARLGNTMAT